jgi:hypothetical protein
VSPGNTHFLITITRAPRRPLVVLNHIPAHHHGHLALPQQLPQLHVPRVHQLRRLQLGLVPYPGIAARVQQDVDYLGAGGPLGLGQGVDVAHGFVKRQVALDAVGQLNLDAFLVEQDVEDLVYSRVISEGPTRVRAQCESSVRQRRTAPICSSDVQTPVPHAILRFVQHLRDVCGRLLPLFRGCRCEVGDCFLEQVGVVAATRFEDKLTRRRALDWLVHVCSLYVINSISIHLRPPC